MQCGLHREEYISQLTLDNEAVIFFFTAKVQSILCKKPSCRSGLHNKRPARTFSVAENVAKARLRIICPFRISFTLQRNRPLWKGIFPHESNAPTAFFSTQVCFFSQPECQGRKEFRWCSWQEASLVPRCSNLRSFGSKCTFRNKCAIVIRRPGYCGPCPPRYAPAGCLGLMMKNCV